jgi:hydroxyethylthiazole kinase-like sugar kinase family protein
MANTRGVFRLTYIIEEKISIDSWISLSDVWVAPSPSGSPVRFIDGAAATLNTGYFGGGEPGPKTTMDKVTYSSDTTAAVPGAFLSVARYILPQQETQQQDTLVVVPGVRSTMDKVTYSSDTTAAVPGAFLSVARYYLAATGNSTQDTLVVVLLVLVE